jgi:hypothetical protein
MIILFGKSAPSTQVILILKRRNIVNIEWTSDKVKRLLELLSDPNNFSESDIANTLSEEFKEVFSRDAVHNKKLRVQVDGVGDNLVSKPIPEMPYWSKYKDIIMGDALPKNVELLDKQCSMIVDKDNLKILHLGDLHIPFQLDEQVQLAANRNRTADIVLSTEISDFYSLSRFNKNLDIPLEREIDEVLRYYEFLNETFPLSIIMAGNHSKRVVREFMKVVNPSLFFLINSNMLNILAKPFPRVVTTPSVLFQINDAIFTHYETFSRTDMKSAVNVYQVVNEWKEVLGLLDYRCIVQSHTHMMGTSYRHDCKIMESGCLCTVPDYAVQGFYSKPQSNGYVVVVQKDGKTDFNLTREYVFPTPKYIASFNPTGGGVLGSDHGE